MKLDIANFFSTGCVGAKVTDLDLELEHEIAWNQILLDDFEFQDEESYQPQRIPTWDKPLTNAVPMAYQALVEKFIDSGYFDQYFSIFKRFDKLEYMLHHTVQGYENLWHGHFKDASHMHLFFYFGSDRSEEDGGKLEVGRIKEGTIIDFDKYHLVGDMNKIEKTGSFMCDHGDMVLVWNANPFLLHQVTKVLTEKPRYTLMVSCGYKSNIEDEKRFSKYL
jgi:hypothetical protein